MTHDELPLDNPMLVRWEFASEERLEQRNAIYRQLIEGVNAEDLAVAAVGEVAPARVLDVGCGAGELAARIASQFGADVTGLDSSERMVDLTRERGITGVLGDIQDLPFDDASFDCVLAAWVIYHVADRETAISECARVLRLGGRLVAPTLDDENLADLWAFLGAPSDRTLTFSSANGAEQLRPHFTRVEAREAHGTVVFPTPDAMRRLVAANMTRAHLAAQVPDFTEPVRVRTHHTVFVADKA